MAQQFNSSLNTDISGSVKTSAVYDDNVAQWMMKVQNYAKTAGGLWVPQKCADDGTALVQLTGRNVDVINLVNATAVTDVNSRNVIVSPSKYKSIDFRITNTHNQPVKIFFRQLNGVPDSIKLLKSDGTYYYYESAGILAIYHTIPAGSSYVMLSQNPLVGPTKSLPYQDYLFDFRLYYIFGVAPTSGSITIDLVGVPN